MFHDCRIIVGNERTVFVTERLGSGKTFPTQIFLSFYNRFIVCDRAENYQIES